MSSSVHLWLILWRTYETIQQHALQHIESLGIGFSDFAVLELLLHKGPAPVNRIGEKVRLTSGSITVAVDRLERKRLVERRSDPSDRRTRVVHLTESGRKLISCAFADHERALERAMSVLSEEERMVTMGLLKKLGLSAQAMLGEPGK